MRKGCVGGSRVYAERLRGEVGYMRRGYAGKEGLCGEVIRGRRVYAERLCGEGGFMRKGYAGK